jgi:hypothetical protein
MIFTKAKREIGARQQEQFMLPRYKDYCLSNIPSTILYLFGALKGSPLSEILNSAGVVTKNSKKIILFFIDGFGYQQWMKYSNKYEFLRQFNKKKGRFSVNNCFSFNNRSSLDYDSQWINATRARIARVVGLFR